jgi:hypothetical protein
VLLDEYNVFYDFVFINEILPVLVIAANNLHTNNAIQRLILCTFRMQLPSITKIILTLTGHIPLVSRGMH